MVQYAFLVGLEHGSFFHILGMSSSHLTFIFFRGVAQPPTSFCLPPFSVIWVCLKMLCTPFYPMVLLIIIPIKWLFHWEYTLFSDKPICQNVWTEAVEVACPVIQ